MPNKSYITVSLVGAVVFGYLPGAFAAADRNVEPILRLFESDEPADWRKAFEHGRRLFEENLDAQRRSAGQLEDFAAKATHPAKLWAGALLLFFDDSVMAPEVRDRIAFDTLAKPILLPTDDRSRAEALNIVSMPAFAVSFFDGYPIWSSWEYSAVPTDEADRFLVVRAVSLMSRPEDFCRTILASFLSSDDVQERALAVAIAAHCDPLIAIPICQQGTTDEEGLVRYLSVCGAASVSLANPDMAEHVAPIVYSALADDDPQVRRAASWWFRYTEYADLTPTVSPGIEKDVLEMMVRGSLDERAAFCTVLRRMPAKLSADASEAAARVIWDAIALGEYYNELTDAFVILSRVLPPKGRGRRMVEEVVKKAMHSDVKEYRLSASAVWLTWYGPTDRHPWGYWKDFVFDLKSLDPDLWLAAYRSVIRTAPNKEQQKLVFEHGIGSSDESVATGLIDYAVRSQADKQMVAALLTKAMQSDRDAIRLSAAGALLRLDSKDRGAHELLREELQGAQPRSGEFDIAVDAICRWTPASEAGVDEKVDLLASVVVREDVDLRHRIQALRAMLASAPACCRVVPTIETILAKSPHPESQPLRRIAIAAAAEQRLHSAKISKYLAQIAVAGRPSEQATARAAIQRQFP